MFLHWAFFLKINSLYLWRSYKNYKKSFKKIWLYELNNCIFALNKKIKIMTNVVKTQRVKLTNKVGSYFNYLMSNNSSQPIVGGYATQMLYSDRHVYLVSEVSENCENVKLEILRTIADGDNLSMGHQSWVHKPTGYFINIEWRKDKWVIKSQTITWVDSFWNSIKDLNMNSEEYKNLTEGLWDENYDMILVKGKTRVKTNYSRINILFNADNYYYDWSF